MPEMVLATFNLHAGVDGWGRPFDVAEVCRQLAADVIVLQEDWVPDEAEAQSDLAAARLGCTVHRLSLARGYVFGPPPQDLRGWGPRPGSSRIVPSLRLDGYRSGRGRAALWPLERTAQRGSWGVSVLSRLPVLRTETTDLGKLRRDPVRRAALMIALDAFGTELHLVATHLSHLTQGSPRQLLRLRRALPPAMARAALAGDMNLWGPPVSAILPGWRRAAIGRTWPATRPIAQLDHIFVTDTVGVVGGQVLDVPGSDHLPVRATLSIG